MNNLIKSWRETSTNDKVLNKGLKQSEKKIEKRFINKITTDTNYFSSKMGVGLDRMNIHTVSAIAEAYALSFKNEFKHKNILVAHDNRTNSKLFAAQVSSVLANHGITSIIFKNDKVYPLPLISFVIRNGDIDGGLVISSSNTTVNHSGIKIFSNDGSFIKKEQMIKITKVLSSVDFLKVETQNQSSGYVSKSMINDYKKAIADIKLSCSKKPIKAIFSSHHGMTTELLKSIFEKDGVILRQTASLNTKRLLFDNPGASDPLNEKSFVKGINASRKSKTDLVFSFSQEGRNVGVAVRHKKRYKFLNANKLASLVLNHRISSLKGLGKLNEDSYIVTTVNAGNMPRKIAEKHGVRVLEVKGDVESIKQVIDSNGTKDFLLAFDENNNFIIDPKISLLSDSIQLSVAITDAAKELANKGITLYEEYKTLELEHGIYINSKISKKLSESSCKKIIKKIMKLKKIEGHKVKKIIDYRELGISAIKVIFASGSWISINFEKNNYDIEIILETFGEGSSNKLDLFPFKREVQEWVKENTEEFSDKTFTKKGFLKYFMFTSIAIGILVFVFMYIYGSLSSNGSDKSLLKMAGWWADSPSSRWIWLTYWGWKAFTLFISAWMKKRMFQRLNEKVKTRHLMISAVMGSVIAFVTPFAVGGDAIGYWYLRRKKVKRSVLIATLASSTLWGESKFAIQTVLLVWIGWPVYEYIFMQDNPQAHAALIWFFIGLVWTVFSSFMIMVLTLSKRFQEFIVKYSVIVLEWLPLIHIHNLEDKESDVQYEFFLIRTSMKKIWNKWWFVLEMVFYDLITLFFNPIVILMMCSGMINPLAPSGEYWTPIVTGDIVGTANSMSITPGGSGTGEWLGLVTKGVQFENTPLTKDPHKLTAEQINAAQDMFYKMFIGWPFLVVSTSTIFITMLTNRKNNVTAIANGKLKFILVSSLIIILTIYLLLIITKVIF